MKVAKLEIEVILAFMLAGFEFDVVDKYGKRPMELPKQIGMISIRLGRLENLATSSSRELLSDKGILIY